jgi:diacylglycerol O-acyltransferase / wax synthase
VPWPVLDGSGLLDPDGRLRIETVRRAIDARPHLVPRFRQLHYRPRRGLGLAAHFTTKGPV